MTDVYMKVNRPIFWVLYIRSADNYVYVNNDSDVYSMNLSINGEQAVIDNLSAISPDNVYHFAFEQAIDWSNIANTWVYNSFSWYVIAQSPTHVYFLISDIDGQYKIPRSNNGNLWVQLKNDGSFDQLQDTDGYFPELLQFFDEVTIDLNDTLDDSILRNGGETSLYAVEHSEEYLFPTNNLFGADNGIKNIHVDDGIYTITNYMVNNVNKTISLVVINGIFHIVVTKDGNSIYPAYSEGPVCPVSDLEDGTVCNLRDSDFAGLWAEEVVTDENGSVNEYTQAMSEYIPSNCIGEPIIIANEGSERSFPVSSPISWFDVG